MVSVKGLQIVIVLAATLRVGAVNQTRCYGPLGCFSTGGAYSGSRALRYFAKVLPWDRDRIQTTFHLFTQNNREEPDRLRYDAVNETTLKDSHFDPAKKLVVLVHGYMQVVRKDQTQRMFKNTFLDAQDCNFVFVDWSKGSKCDYREAAVNTRLVGAEIALFLEKIIRYYSFEKSKIHLFGHSLGSHVIGYAGARLHGLGRLTALDAADPLFQGGPPEIRIDPSDADFVDALHTDGRAYKPLKRDGFGMWDPVGHVDVYVNGGIDQPFCATMESVKVVHKTINETNPFLLMREVGGCHHQYVVRLAIGVFAHDENCKPIAYRCSNYSSFLHGLCADCGPDTANCYELGEGGSSYRRFKDVHGWPKQFFILTNVGPPYCMHHFEIRLQLSNETDVTEAKITFVLEDIDGTLSPRALLHDGKTQISRQTREDSQGEYPQAWVIGVVSTIKSELRTIRMTWTTRDRKDKLKLGANARMSVYYMNRIIPTEEKSKHVEEFCGPKDFLVERKEIIFTKC